MNILYRKQNLRCIFIIEEFDILVESQVSSEYPRSLHFFIIALLNALIRKKNPGIGKQFWQASVEKNQNRCLKKRD